MATIRQRKRKDGSKAFRVEVRLKGCPPQSATFDRISDAKKWATQTEAAIREGRHFKSIEAKKHTLAEAIDRYIADVLPTKRTGHKKLKSLLKYWKDELGPYTLAEVTPARISESRDKLARGKTYRKKQRSPATCNRYTAALSNVFTYAVRQWGWMESNPVSKVDKLPESRGRVRTITDDERKNLLEKCKESRDKRLYAMVVVALSTGMRQGELLGLEWGHVVWEDEDSAMAILHETKNRERRAVPIRGEAAKLLRERSRVRRLGNNFVFASPKSGKPLFPQKAWEDALEAADIDDFRWHDLRHTAATYLAESGATLAELSAILGHRTLAMVKRYQHLTEQHTSGVVEKMNQRVFGS